MPRRRSPANPALISRRIACCGAVLCAATLLASCASLVDDQVAASPQSKWSPPSDVPAPPPVRATALEKYAKGQPLDLVALTDIALENNTSTRMAWLGAKAAAAQRLQARSGWLPQVSVGYTRQEQALGAIPGLPSIPGVPSGGSRTITYGPTYSISQMIYDFGGVQGASAAAKEALYAANFSYNQSLQDVILAVLVNYYQTTSAESGLAAANVALQDARTGYEVAKTRNTVGLGARGDFLRAESNLRSAEFQVEQQAAVVEQNRAALAQVLGITVTPDLKLAPPAATPAPETLTRDLATLTSEAIARRPDLQAAAATVRARQESIRSSQAGYLPTLSTSLSGQRSYQKGAPNNPSNNWTFSLNLNWSIFDGLGTAGRVAAARAQAQSAEESLRQQQIAVVANVWAQYYAVQSAAKQVASAHAGLAAANEALQLVEQGYRSGLNSLTDFLSAQKDLAAARQQDIQAGATLAISLARMAHATGAIETPARAAQ